jgi:hypothetical protein
MRLRPSRTKTVFLLAISLAFTVIGVGAIGRGRGFVGWFVALFFGVCSTAFAIHLLPGASYLDLSPDGFVVSSLFRRWPLIRWDSVSEFHVAPVPGSGVRKVVFSRDSSRHARLAAISVSLVGATDTLPDTYGRTADQLAGLMNEWRLRAIGSDARQ